MISILAPWLCSGGLLQPEDLVYKGAIGTNWDYAGTALGYYPPGDPGGTADGYPGSLFGRSYHGNSEVTEVAIPQPVVSKTFGSLHLAQTLHAGVDINPDPDNPWCCGPIHVHGLQYLLPQGQQEQGKMYVNWGYYWCCDPYGEYNPTMGWINPDLSDPQPTELWFIDSLPVTRISGYILDIPKAWADAYVQGRYIGTGMFRANEPNSEGGPSLYAVAPWGYGNPPDSGAVVRSTPLIAYTLQHPLEDWPSLCSPSGQCHKCEEWNGAAWLTSGDDASFIIAGTKCLDQCAAAGSHRGTPSNYKFVIMFYDPDDLAAVAQGVKQPWEPQPYAYKDITEIVWHTGYDAGYENEVLGSIAYDREHGLLYIIEQYVYDHKPIIHVFQHEVSSGVGQGTPDMTQDALMVTAAPNPFNASVCIEINHGRLAAANVEIKIYAVNGVCIANSVENKNEFTIGQKTLWNAHDHSSGLYLVCVRIEKKAVTIPVMLIR
ncbi:MAG: hypothetical protein A2487_04290 [Candidatus Raymondbacteria bacterium RifOxyC12_full_50_8]|uniref:Secretion system C-terminal sorting domain-containing protein n=1 Tax=Candidatus Raymondbacteria bacterium RIFOXYD12_FULL_49_13 TaxID=1817890 RepID=A0A1F7F7F1_UNCRA|nr:MAG: hypothetical protein A2248_00230 [Candidatus Raymondbacteria bacterium RIFOXYA2_FULL_49_16]OGJ96171.1 MAG: hypothetical protein A2453_05580 [Candidatus Raymondbacteria bacterium RIFOXYC2_FULL_50_21]OGK02426.1 MAG: hypothetical protein A2519_14505 [Candidatus Raymondbacteria bacterium RIFOXYD12_FULL_49_13]OGK03545.1 MAG: hypothetical protein A2350_15955 [Candidatus Raymondbacteria bacterium RifOxyB12_full_50_8]OGK07576.1 MAG: hypothetical protein A2487_04290 [Candidatus Raymondbacteria b